MSFGLLGASFGHQGVVGQGGGRSLAPLRVVANRGEVPQATIQASTSGRVCFEGRLKCTLGGQAATELRVVFGGYYTPSTNIETNIGNDQSIEAAIEISGVTKRLTFGSANVGTVQDGVVEYISDPLLPSAFGLTTFAANTVFWLRQRRTVSLNQFFSSTLTTGLSGEIGWLSDGTSANQVMGTGNLIAPTGGVSTSPLMPLAIIGRTVAPEIAVLGLGDSIMADNNDTGGDGSAGGGWFARGLFSVNGRTVPWGRVSRASSAVQGYIANQSKRSALYKYFTHAVVLYGTNDMAGAGRTAAQVLADLQTLWGQVRGAGSSIRHLETVLIFPRCTATTDSWATTAGQTVVTGFETGGAKRDPVNAGLISGVGSNGLDNYIDLNGAAADTVALDRWAVNGTANYGTSDGVHPSPAISVLAGALFNPRAATWT